MKSSKRDTTNVQRKNAGKKTNQKAGSVKLDRKSSRGMIYENEELRLRTININAEVERGQSDIRKLRRENEQLRREIWSLRDEYDRLNKRFKANKYLPDSISEHGQSESNSEDSDSCDTCRGEADINDECVVDQYETSSTQRDSNFPSLPPRQHQKQFDRCIPEGSMCSRADSYNEQRNLTVDDQPDSSSTPTKSRDHLHVNFDHLSIVSEENLSNSDGNLTQPVENNSKNLHQQQQQSLHNYYYDENFTEIDDSRLSPSHCMGAMSLPSLVGPITPMTPIEMVANQLNDLQSMVPPLSYFENIVQQHMGTTITSIADSNPSTHTGETVIQTNGWDYNIQSPFVQRKFQQSSEPSSSNSTSATMSPSHLVNPIPVVPVSREGTPQQADTSTNSASNSKNHKHFFSPIKPRLKLDTALAAKSAFVPPVAVQYLDQLHSNCDPPDVYITNALASPYYPQPIAGHSLPSVLVQPVQQQSYSEPIYATAQKKAQCPEQIPTTAGSSKDSVNLEEILNEIGTISEDILQMQLEKSKSEENLTTEGPLCITTVHSSSSATTTPLHTAIAHSQTLSSTSSPINLPKESQHHQAMPSDKNRKPYRSEMNLLLSYNGSNPVIIPLDKNSPGRATATTTEAAQVSVTDTDRDGNSPSPPQVPTPMAPFPTNLMYLGFDRLNQPPPLGESGEYLYAKTGLQQYIPSTSTSSLDASHQPPQPPIPPPPPLPALPANMATIRSNEINVMQFGGEQDVPNPALTISSPELATSPLIGANLAAIAPLKRRIFSRQNDDGNDPHVTRSYDGGEVFAIKNDAKQIPAISLPEAVRSKLLLEGSANEISSYESSSGSEATKRKSMRRVSIVCRDEKANNSSIETTSGGQRQHQTVALAEKFDDMMPSLAVTLKHAHSTPNSPHSNRRRAGNTNSAISVNSGSATLHHHGHHHHHHHHHHNRKLSQESIAADARGTSVTNSIVNSSQNNVLGAAATMTPSHQHSTRYKCSRRHSEGTVSSMVGDRGGGGSVSGGTGVRLSSTGNHHHHHHHHHQQDSNQETGTSISERNSGSMASSRESSTSLSMRSQRRKISVSSHTGGKIPWCGCWGNGCL